jgi:hypothetical protein
MDAEELFNEEEKICNKNVCGSCPFETADGGCSKVIPEIKENMIAEYWYYRLEAV